MQCRSTRWWLASTNRARYRDTRASRNICYEVIIVFSTLEISAGFRTGR